MTFTVERRAFIVALERFSQDAARRQQGATIVRLVACDGRIYLRGTERTDEVQAVVWEHGQCAVLLPPLIDLLHDSGWDPNLTAEVDRRGFQVGGCSIPVCSYCSWALAPEDSSFLVATD